MNNNEETETYFDFVIIGSGLSESILSAILSQSKYKVLQIDAHDRYGSFLQTYNYTDFCNAHNKEPIEELKQFNRDFNIDYTPKVLLAGGLTQKSLINFDLSVLVNFLLIPGSYIYKNKLYEVPTSETQSLKTGLISFLQKPRVIRFFYNIRKYFNNKEVKLMNTMKEQFEHYGIDTHSAQVIGHAIALNIDDEYLKEDPKVTFEKIKLYIESLVVNKDEISAFIYPLYGASELCQAFVRKAALAGAVLRLNTETVSIHRENEKVTDYPFCVRIKPKSESELDIHCKRVISSPSLLERKPMSKTVVRGTLIVEGVIPLLKNVPSAQILFLSSGLERKSDVFVLILGHRECVAPKGYKIVLVSYIKEGPNDNTLQKIIKLFGNVKDTFVREENIFISPESNIDGWYIVKGNDESMHVENGMEEVVKIVNDIKRDGFNVQNKFV